MLANHLANLFKKQPPTSLSTFLKGSTEQNSIFANNNLTDYDTSTQKRYYHIGTHCTSDPKIKVYKTLNSIKEHGKSTNFLAIQEFGGKGGIWVSFGKQDHQILKLVTVSFKW